MHEGLFIDGRGALLGYQVIASIVTLVFSFVVSFLIAKVIDATIGVPVSALEEEEGLDLSLHGEPAYDFSGEPDESLVEAEPALR